MLTYSDRVIVSPREVADLVAFAIEVAERAGRATLRYFRSAVAVEDKRTEGRFDPVTAADGEAELVVRQAIEDRYPRHGILGEEFGHRPGNGLTWVIDPIDGTRAFMTGMLHWGVLLALFDGETPVLGVMHQPFTGETFHGDNVAAYYRHAGRQRPLHCRPCRSLEEAVLMTTSPRWFRTPQERAAFDRLEGAVKMSKYGGDCYIYAMLAMGLVDLATDASLKPYDIQALIPIVRGAGGVVSTVRGENASFGGMVVAAGDAHLHRLALERMSP